MCTSSLPALQHSYALKKQATCFWGPCGTLNQTQSLAVPILGLRPMKT